MPHSILAMQTSDPNAVLQQALSHHQAGQLDRAIAVYRQLQSKFPGNPQLLFLLGSAEGEKGNSKEAVRWLEQCLAVDPSNANAYNNLGLALGGLKRHDEALQNFDRAIALQPGNADPFINKGLALRGLGRYGEALACFDRAVALQPANAEQHNNRANVLLDLRRPEEALAGFHRAIELQAGYAEAYANRSLALQALGRIPEAIASVDLAITLNPSLAEAHNFRGDLMLARRREAEANESFQRAYALDARLPYVYPRLLFSKLRICDWTDVQSQLAKLEARIGRGEQLCSPFDALGLTGSPAVQLRVAQAYGAVACPPQTALGAIPRRERGTKIRIGYYSSEFRDHATTRLMAELFELHDRSRFELVGFDFGPLADDPMRRRVAAAFDRFVDVRRTGDRDVARRSRELQVDIAVDLKGYTEDSRPGIFAERAAPVQASYLGFPGTMGVPYMDYIIADRVVIPEASQPSYTEKVVYLPDSYQVNDRKRPISDREFTRAELGLPSGAFVFCCFNNNYKIAPPTFDVWMRILKRIDGSVLWLIEDNPTTAANLRKEAERRGIAADRLVFARKVPLPEHLARHRAADLFLDTLPYNAHTTASDALWAGLPVLTWAGEAFASRVAASLLTAIDLPELITTSATAFESAAVALASEPGRLAEVRARLARHRETAPLFDAPRFARHLESAYEQMLERWLAGLPPDAIHVPRA